MNRAFRAVAMMAASIVGCATSVSAAGSGPVAAYPPMSATPIAGGIHDFDFNLGRWNARLRQRAHPLAGSNAWTESAGTMSVRPLLGGAGNLVEISASGAAGPINLIALRLYDAKTHEWTLTFATSGGGAPSPPLVGHFAHGRGVFYDQEIVGGRSVLVRFTFFAGTTQYHDEQAYSADGGATWEVNFLGTFTKQSSSH